MDKIFGPIVAQFAHQPVEWSLGLIQALAIINKAAINVSVWDFSMDMSIKLLWENAKEHYYWILQYGYVKFCRETFILTSSDEHS